MRAGEEAVVGGALRPGEARVAEIIRTDPSLTAQVLRLCNSAPITCAVAMG